MNRTLICLCATIALALAACAHYPTGDEVAPDGGGCGICPDGQSCVDGTCTTTPPDGGNNPDGGVCTGSTCPTDGGSGMTDGGTGGSDGGSGGTDAGTGGSDGGGGGGMDGGTGGGSDGGTTCGTCPEGQTCVDGACVCDGDGDDGSDRVCAAGKTLLCHVPPGHPDNMHDICVGDAAVPAHLGHGDTLGACP